MFKELVRPLALLSLPLLGILATYVVVRRPRKGYALSFAGVLVGLIILHLGNAVLYRPNLSLRANYFWQVAQSYGGWVAIFSGTALAITLHHKPLARWEKIVVAVIVTRMLMDLVWLATLQAQPDNACGLHPSGHPRLACGLTVQAGIIVTSVCVLLMLTLFLRASAIASGRHRVILRRYLGLVIACVLIAGALNHLLGYFNRVVFPSEIPVLLGVIVTTRMLLLLEEEESAQPAGRWREALVAWLALLVVAVIADIQWLGLSLPILTFSVLAIGVGAGAAWIAARLAVARPPATEVTTADPPPVAMDLPALAPPELLLTPPVDQPARDEPRLRIYLLGPMRVVRDGQLLSYTDEAGRMRKTLRLLADLAVMGKTGVSRDKLAEDLWPEEPNRARILTTYLSTLRHILEPQHRRGQSQYLVQKGERMFLQAGADLWVDVWAFDELANKAQRLAAAGDLVGAASCWDEAAALYDAEGLLPDGDFLPGVVDAGREHLHRQWQTGLRFLAHYHAGREAEGAHEQAAGYWQMLHADEPWDEEAYARLADYYRQTGQMGRLRALEQEWEQDAED